MSLRRNLIRRAVATDLVMDPRQVEPAKKAIDADGNETYLDEAKELLSRLQKLANDVATVDVGTFGEPGDDDAETSAKAWAEIADDLEGVVESMAEVTNKMQDQSDI